VGQCGGSAVARRRQGVAGEHRWGPGVAPGKEERIGAHRNGGSMVASGGGVQWRQCRSGGRRRGWLGPAARGRPGGEEAAVN
jgi:hypothetical protein